jgi:AcrR family transcriptional regulator
MSHAYVRAGTKATKLESDDVTLISKRRRRDPGATKTAILEATVECLAAAGPEGITLSDVAEKANVNRSTAYEYFKTRENLINQTREWASDKLFRAVFGDPVTLGERQIENVDLMELTARIANFASDNAELCRVWLMQALSLPDPATDPFWREYEGGSARFAKTKRAQLGVDAEVFTVVQLAGAMLWPVHVRARVTDKAGLKAQVHKYVRESVRFALFGSVNPDYYPDLIERLKLPVPSKPPGPRVPETRVSTSEATAAQRAARHSSVPNGCTLTLTMEGLSSRQQTLTVYDDDAVRLWRACGSTLFGAGDK